MSLKKDKQKVLGEVFDDERIRTFFNYPAPEGVNADYHLLEKSYRGMKAENFATFIQFFIEGKHDINATNPAGLTFLQEIKTHRLAEDYIKLMQDAGAQG